ncbi:hypothetical protein [Nitrospira sp. M1]
MSRQSHAIFLSITGALLACLTIFLSAAVFGAMSSQEFWLITPEEAAMKPAQPNSDSLNDDPFSEIGREMMKIGPIVEVVKPGTDSTIGSPVEVLIHFKERLAKVNLGSLHVEVEKFINIDITDRVKPYATDTGIHIPDVPLPSGEHTIIFYIEDTKGNPTELNVTISVA